MGENADLSRVPVSALRKATIAMLSGGLNPHKVIPTDEGLPRDWRGLAHLIGLNGVETSKIASSNDPMAELLHHWGAQGTVEMLNQFLALIDRFDILDDSQMLVAQDIEVYLNKATSSSSISLMSSRSINESDASILTVDDVVRIEQGLEPQQYDAYLLFADEDIDFASEIVHTMEQQHKLKLCIRDRDLVGGITFEHDAIMKLIAERCRRLLVVVTPSFLKSPANKFFVTFAQALGIDQRQRKVIPILYQKCDLPPELSYYFLLDYSRAGVLWNFWDKLRDSIQTPDTPSSSTNTSSWMTHTPRATLPLAITASPTPTTNSPQASPKQARSPDDEKKPLLKNVTSFLSSLVGRENGSKEGKKNKPEKSGDKAKNRRKKVEPLLS